MLLTFNKNICKTEVCVIALISNENIESFDNIYQYLYNILNLYQQ